MCVWHKVQAAVEIGWLMLQTIGVSLVLACTSALCGAIVMCSLWLLWQNHLYCAAAGTGLRRHPDSLFIRL